MADILDLYNQISESADKAIKRTAELLKLSETLSVVKPVGSTLFHGALGPGLLLYDPLERFAKGEVAFHKAAEEFIKDSKQMQLAGEGIAKGLEASSKTTVRAWGETAREWTNTSKMMEGTIETLSKQTGILAKSFSSMAQVIKVATGPIGTAILVASTAYTDFVKKWEEDSARLQRNIQATAALFKGGDAFGVRAAMEQAGQSGMSRQEFFQSMSQASRFGQAPQASATQLVQLAPIMAPQAGRTSAEQMNVLTEHFATQRARGVSEQKIQEQMTQMRVSSGGPAAGQQVRWPGQRYQEWGEDVGYNVGRMRETLSPTRAFNQVMFSRPGDLIGEAKAGAVGGINRAIDTLAEQKVGIFPSIGELGRGVAGAFQLGAQAMPAFHEAQARRYRATAEHLDKFGEPRAEEARRLRFLGGIEGVAGLRKQIEIGQPAEAKALGKQGAELQKEREKIVASEQIAKLEGKMPEVTAGYETISKLGKTAVESGNAELIKAASKAVDDLQKKWGMSQQELANAVETYNKNSKDVYKPGEIEKAKKDLEEADKAHKKATEASAVKQEFLKKISSGMSEIPVAGYSLEDISKASAGGLEEILEGRREQLLKLQKEIKEASLKPIAKGSAAEKELAVKKETLLELKGKEIGLAPGHQKQYEELLKTKGPEEAEKFLRGHQQNLDQQIMQQKMLEEQEKTRTFVGKSQKRTAGVAMPVQLQAMRASGQVSEEQALEIAKAMYGEQGTGKLGTEEIRRGQALMQEAQVKHQVALQEVDLKYTGQRRSLERQGMGTAVSQMGLRGGLTQIEAWGAHAQLAKAKTFEDVGMTQEAELVKRDVQNKMQVAQEQQQVRMGKVDLAYAPQQIELSKRGMTAGAQGMVQSGIMNEADAKKIYDLVAKGDEVSLHHAQQITQITQQRAQLEDQILKIKTTAIQREGTQAGIGLQIGSMAGRGMLGAGEAGALSKAAAAGPRAFDQSAPVIQQILNVRKKMFDDELNFVIAHSRAEMQIISTHYDNLIKNSKAKLEQLDAMYGPHQQFAGTVFGSQQSMAQAQMGRYAGEDYWRQQQRGERGIRESGMDLAFSMAGGQVPQQIQMVRAIRHQREARQDFKRQQARQMEADTASIGAESATRGAIAGATGGKIGETEFYMSEGGRDLNLQMLKQNQAAYSRRGIDVSGRIRQLEGQKQEFAGKKLASEMTSRKLQSTSLEKQIAAGEAGLEKLKPGEQRQKGQVALAETYAKAAEHARSVGDLEKAKEYTGRQEKALEGVPDILQKDFGDTQKQSLTQLEAHTKILTEINRALGGKPPETNTGVEPDEGDKTDVEGTGEKGGFNGAVGDFKDAVEGFKKAVSTPIQVTVNGSGSGSSNSGSEYGNT